MRLYFAPMEGITGYVYRSAHRRFFPGVDRYYSPFITPNHGRTLTSKELNDVLPEHNEGVPLVPQILANNAEYFLWCAEKLRALGYEEVNLNLGCPSTKVANKGRGSGFLSRPEELDRFLDAVFSGASVRVSIKTRVGGEDEDEWPRLMEIFRQYPVCELIVHPRVRRDIYRGAPRMEAFRLAMRESKAPLAYNGDLFSEADIAAFREAFPEIGAVMLGRGFIADPGLGMAAFSGARTGADTYRAFAEDVCEGYLREWGDRQAVLFHMKEIWSYMISLFPDSEKEAKAIRKAADIPSYRAAVDNLFREKPMQTGQGWSFRRL